MWAAQREPVRGGLRGGLREQDGPHAGQRAHPLRSRAIKAGAKAIDAIIAERDKDGAYGSLFEFCERAAGHGEQATIELLIKSARSMRCTAATSGRAWSQRSSRRSRAGQKLAADRAAGQRSSVPDPAEEQSQAAAVPLVKAEAWGESETLRREGHARVLRVEPPARAVEGLVGVLRSFGWRTRRRAAGSARDRGGSGAERAIVVRNGRAGQKMGIVTLEDLTGTADAVMFADCYAKFSHLFEDDGPKFVMGRMDYSRGSPQIIVDRMVPIEGQPPRRAGCT